MTGPRGSGEVNLRILVVCTGNLCRSPFAEHILLKKFGGLGLDDMAVASAGIGALPGTPCPANVLEAARGWGLDLTGHRSRQVALSDVEEADLVLAMEGYHYHALLAAFPKHGEKLHLLSQFDDEEEDQDVADPMGLPIEETRTIFGRIARCADTLARYYAAT